jgi:hypothetical protein
MFRSGRVIDTSTRRLDNDVIPGRPIRVVDGQIPHAGDVVAIRVNRPVKDGGVVIHADDVHR